tara:strand:- start:1083 stop:1589 length:507 start_codon:yes stop_codon:yes gene_type:complete
LAYGTTDAGMVRSTQVSLASGSGVAALVTSVDRFSSSVVEDDVMGVADAANERKYSLRPKESRAGPTKSPRAARDAAEARADDDASARVRDVVGVSVDVSVDIDVGDASERAHRSTVRPLAVDPRRKAASIPLARRLRGALCGRRLLETSRDRGARGANGRECDRLKT